MPTAVVVASTIPQVAQTIQRDFTSSSLRVYTNEDVPGVELGGTFVARSFSADFKQLLADAEELVKSAASDTGTKLDQADDEFGYRWMIFYDDDFEFSPEGPKIARRTFTHVTTELHAPAS